EALGLVAAAGLDFDVVVPTVPRQAGKLRDLVATWPVQAEVVAQESEKFAAFRRARAALAASGTVTLELALAGVPMVGSYRVAGWEAFLARRLIRTPFVLPPNIILGEAVVPELLQENATAERLAQALAPLLSDTPA